MSPLRVDILTLFPAMFEGPFGESIVKRGANHGLLDIRCHDLRGFTHDRHRTVDDYPYGGGAGMVLKPDPVFEGVEMIVASGPVGHRPRVILMTPQGRRLTQETVVRLAGLEWLLVICGHYEGVDERIRAGLVEEEISLGDFVVTGGELPAMVLVDAVSRLVPGVLEDDSVSEESFSDGLLEYPQYTRPPIFRGMAVPEVLVSGHHEKVRLWRRRESLRRTLERRPDLLELVNLRREDERLLAEIRLEATPREEGPKSGG
ncbi:MAG TPA: tRNA (guanosine(37)-N1)-methyltransferase TrmD [Bacillota bacterium]|jgi:tRNA (guanine37-N1)-methyltransferase